MCFYASFCNFRLFKVQLWLTLVAKLQFLQINKNILNVLQILKILEELQKLFSDTESLLTNTTDVTERIRLLNFFESLFSWNIPILR